MLYTEFGALVGANRAIDQFEQGIIGEEKLQTALKEYADQITAACLVEAAIEILTRQRMDRREPYTDSFDQLADTDSVAAPLVDVAKDDFLHKFAEIKKAIGIAAYSFERLEADKDIVFETVGMMLFTVRAEEIRSMIASMQLLRDIKSGNDFYYLRQELGWITDGYIPQAVVQQAREESGRLSEDLLSLARTNNPHQNYGYGQFRKEGDDFSTALRKSTARLKAFRTGADKIKTGVRKLNSLIKEERDKRRFLIRTN